MASFDAINYSLRPAKSIQQQLAFEGVRLLDKEIDLDRAMYVGLSSVWFTDFVLVHRMLGVEDMVSIEKDEIASARARFNKPFRTVVVRDGMAGEVLEAMYDDKAINERPWIVWLDYDGSLDAGMLSDLRALVEKAPGNTVVLTTFNGHESNYGRLVNDGVQERREYLVELFGDAFDENVPQNALKGSRLAELLRSLALAKLGEYASIAGRSGGFTPAFSMIYTDGAPMITVGGILPTKGDRRTVSGVVAHHDWPCMLDGSIEAPPLTMLEALTLQAQHPRYAPLTRDEVRELGFDLRDDQLATFARYYRQYPTYVKAS